MKILMLTNTYKPHLSGVAKSVETCRDRLISHGHRVVVIAPEYPGAVDEPYVFRVPSFTNSNGYSIPLSISIIKNVLNYCIRFFKPEVIHSHHPVLLGDVALEIGKSWNVPVVFTYHTVYEQHVHHSGIPELFQDEGQLVSIYKALSYCSKVNHVVAPSNGIRSMLRSRGVIKPISVVPTGIDDSMFDGSCRRSTRKKLGISDNDFVLGHVGRLTKEKNLIFLFDVVRRYLDSHSDAKFILVGGQSPDIDDLISKFADLRGKQFIYLGIKRDRELSDIYSSMDCFVFASKSETQGMVLAEAMLCGTPVVAISSTGVDDIVQSGVNGFLAQENVESFLSKIESCRSMSRGQISNSVFSFTIEPCISKILKIYRELAYERKLASGIAMFARAKKKAVS